MDPAAGRDFFISYTGVNRSWAEWIAVQLEAAGYSTVLQAFDFAPGTDFVHEMHQATRHADRTITVLSPAYFASAFSEAEWRTAFAKDPSGEAGLLVPVRVQPCDPPGLLKTRVYVDLVDADERTCRNRLLDAVNKNRVRPTFAPFPGQARTARFPGADPAVNNQANREAVDQAPSDGEVELSPDVVETHSAAFVSAGLTPPARWCSADLSRIVMPRNPSRLSDLLLALRKAVEAKPVLVDMGIGRLELGRLQVIYRRDVGTWPNGASVDALLVEAAEVNRSEKRRGEASGLGALAKFVVGAAAALSLPPQNSPALANWIESLGHQLADAQRHYLDRRTQPSWLLIDLGKEPRPNAIDDPLSATPRWPTRIIWTYTTRHQAITGEVTAVATKEGLAEALKAIFAAVPPSWPLLVDLAMPVGLLGAGIEHWPLFADHSESLTERYYPRLRWSQRRHDLVLHGRCVERAARSSWNTIPSPLVDALLGDETRLKRWIQSEGGHAWLIGRHPTTYRADPLRILLKAGFSFLVWFRHDVDTRHRRLITRAVSTIPIAARRSVIPDELVGLPDLPIVIWDDPRGRGEFELPSLVAAEHIPMH